MEYIVAHDFGTSSAKASLFSIDGRLIKSSTVSYKTYHPEASYAEQDADDWWAAFCTNNHALLADIAEKNILGVSFSGMCPNCLLVDRDFKPLDRAIIWQDTRAVEEAKEISKRLPSKYTAGAPNGILSQDRVLPKLLWVKKHSPELLEKAYKLLPGASDYTILKLTGKAVCDYSVAYRTSMIQRGTKVWSDEVLEISGIPKSLMPELHEPTDIVGTVSEAVAEECGLPAGTKIICGTGDSDCTVIGGGLLKPGDTLLIGSTSAEINAIDHNGRKIGRPSSSSGASLNWMRNNIFSLEKETPQKSGEDAFELMNRKIAETEPGANGVIFLPYLAGELGLRNDAQARGTFTGISLSTTREDLMRAVVEGVGFNLNLMLQNIRAAGVEVNQLPVVGGLGKGEAVRQVFADIFGVPIIFYEHMDQAAVAGAALIAGIGLGIYQDTSEICKFMRPAGVTQPNEKNHTFYEGLMPKFEAIYQALKPIYNS